MPRVVRSAVEIRGVSSSDREQAGRARSGSERGKVRTQESFSLALNSECAMPVPAEVTAGRRGQLSERRRGRGRMLTLDVASFEHFDISHRVLVCKLARDDCAIEGRMRVGKSQFF